MREIKFPVGRLVGGSLYESRTSKDNAGQIKRDASGAPVISFSFGVAFEKAGTTHWGQTAWGAEVWKEGHESWPNGQAGGASFAWKVTDGDSMVPNKNGRKPAENEGWPGHWVVWFSGSYAPKTCNADGTVIYADAEQRIKPGHFVQVYGSVKGNNPSQTPGVYMNFMMTAHSGYGKEIALANSVDAAKVGFGGPLPAGASAVPLGMSTTQAAAIAGAPVAPGAAVPGSPPVPGMAPATPNAALAPPIVPSTAFMQPPAAVPVPVAVVPPAAPVMTAKAAGATYEQFVANGWTLERMRADGYAV